MGHGELTDWVTCCISAEARMHAFRPVPCEPRTGCGAGWDRVENQHWLASCEAAEQAYRHSKHLSINTQGGSFRKTVTNCQTYQTIISLHGLLNHKPLDQSGLIFQLDGERSNKMDAEGKTSIHIIIFKIRLYFEIPMVRLCHLVSVTSAPPS